MYVMAMNEKARCCLFCYRLFNQELQQTHSDDLLAIKEAGFSQQQQFLRILQRYLLRDTGCDSTAWIDAVYSAISSNEIGLENVTSPCLDCSGVLRSFCEYYEETKILEMKLSWNLQSLRNIVKSSEKVKSRRKLFKMKLQELKSLDGKDNLDVKDFSKSVKHFRKTLVKICSKRFQTSYPRVALRRCDSGPPKDTKRGRPPKRPSEHAIDHERKVKKLKPDEPAPVIPTFPTPTGSSITDIDELLSEVISEPVEDNATLEAPSYPECVLLEDNWTDPDPVVSPQTNMDSENYSSEHSAGIGGRNQDTSFPSKTTEMESLHPNSMGIMTSTNQEICTNPAPPEIMTETEASLEIEPTAVETGSSHETRHPESDGSTSKNVTANADVSEGIPDLAFQNIEVKANARQQNGKDNSILKKIMEKGDAISLETDAAAQGRRESLRQKFQCTKCSKKGFSREKLLVHSEICGNESERLADQSESGNAESDADAGQLADVADADFDFDPETIELDNSSDGGNELHDEAGEPETEEDEEKRSQEKKETASKFHCKECGDTFPSRSAFLRHHKVDHADKCEIACEVKECLQKFWRKIDMRKHAKNAHHTVDSYSCCFCKKSSFSRADLILHQNQVHLKIQLDIDPETTTDPDEYPPHGKDKVFNCPVSPCRETFLNQESLESHALLHGEFKCQFCEETKSYAPDLAIHEALSHTNDKRKSHPCNSRKPAADTYSCARCDALNYTEKLYLQHFLRTHLKLTMTVRTMCCICKTVFGRSKCRTVRRFKNRLVEHYQSYHDISSSKSGSGTALFHCDKDDCGAYFLEETQLAFHKFHFHNEKKNFPCSECKKVFSTKADRREHGQKMHKDVFNIPCPRYDQGCEHRFADEASLEKHVSMWHSQRTENLCPECGKAFKTSAYLAMHIRYVHDPNKKPPVVMKKKINICAQCGKEFKRRDQLDMHVLCVHVGPEGWQYSCDICKKKCLTSDKLEAHMRTHRKEKPFTCEHCGLSYAHRHNFRLHLKNKHGIIMEDPRRKKEKVRNNIKI